MVSLKPRPAPAGVGVSPHGVAVPFRAFTPGAEGEKVACPDEERRDAGGQREPDGSTLHYVDAAYNLARWLTRDSAAAEAVVREAFLRASPYLASYQGENGRAWLLRIVRDTCRTALRCECVGPTTPRGDRPVDGSIGVDVLELGSDCGDLEMQRARTEPLMGLETVLSCLPIDLRECLVLRELEKLSYEEIAHVTGVPVGSVMSRLWRGRRALMRAAGLDTRESTLFARCSANAGSH